MYTVAITGGIGSGKTTISKLFSINHDINVLCADRCAKALLHRKEIMDKITLNFSAHKIVVKKKIDYKELRKVIFNNKENLLWLNNLIHPLVRKELYDMSFQSKSIYTLINIPLLNNISLSHYNYIKKVITVTAPLKEKIDRIIIRDNITVDEVKKIMDIQIADKERILFSDYIINNKNGAKLKAQVREIHKKIMASVLKN